MRFFHLKFRPWIYGLTVLILFCQTGCSGNRSEKALESGNQRYEDISAQEAEVLIQKNKEDPHFISLDIRTPTEFESGHIEGAINIDYYAASFSSDLDTLNKENAYLVYCRTGNRTGRTMPLMKRLRFKEVYHMSGGIVQWKQHGYPIVISE